MDHLTNAGGAPAAAAAEHIPIASAPTAVAVAEQTAARAEPNTADDAEGQALSAGQDLPSPAEPKPRRRPRDTRARFARRLNKLSFEAIDCLEEIMTDCGAKAADRIAAAKLTFDVLQRQGDRPDDGEPVRVIIEDAEPELAG